MLEILPVNRLKNAVWDRNVFRLNIMTGECWSFPGLEPTTAFEGFSDFLDIYGNLYYIIDSQNLGEIDALYKKDYSGTRHDANVLIDSLIEEWAKISTSIPFNPCRPPEGEEKEFLANFINEGNTPRDLLLRVLALLKFFDGLMNTYRASHFSKRPYKELDCFRGKLIYQHINVLSNYLVDQVKTPDEIYSYRLPVDPNYLKMNQYVSNLFLDSQIYKRYTIRHEIMNNYRGDQMNELELGEFVIGFMPGDFTSEDYVWKFDPDNENESYGDESSTVPGDNGPDEDDAEAFSYFLIENLEENISFQNNILPRFIELLKTKCHLIMMPELFVPVPMQEQLNTAMIEYLKKNSTSTGFSKVYITTPMLIPGSFHISIAPPGKSSQAVSPLDNDMETFNLSRIYLNNRQIGTVTKMNPYKFDRNPKASGKLKRFQKSKGEEHHLCTNHSITLWETKYGRLAILICVDVINADIIEVLCNRRVDIILVMSMTINPNRGKFKRAMEMLSESTRSLVIISNNFIWNTSTDKSENRNRCPEREDKAEEFPPRIVISIPGGKPYVRNDPSLPIKLQSVPGILNIIDLVKKV